MRSENEERNEIYEKILENTGILMAFCMIVNTNIVNLFAATQVDVYFYGYGGLFTYENTYWNGSQTVRETNKEEIVGGVLENGNETIGEQLAGFKMIQEPELDDAEFEG